MNAKRLLLFLPGGFDDKSWLLVLLNGTEHHWITSFIGYWWQLRCRGVWGRCLRSFALALGSCHCEYHFYAGKQCMRSGVSIVLRDQRQLLEQILWLYEIFNETGGRCIALVLAKLLVFTSMVLERLILALLLPIHTQQPFLIEYLRRFCAY